MFFGALEGLAGCKSAAKADLISEILEPIIIQFFGLIKFLNFFKNCPAGSGGEVESQN
jgi:hypothetical protein